MLAVVVALVCLASLRLGGTEALGRGAAGLLIGAGIALVGHLLRRRAWVAKGIQVIPALMAATIASFALFIALVLAVAILWREATLPVVLSALALYLAVSFHQALATR